jgi:hypothetical protein
MAEHLDDMANDLYEDLQDAIVLLLRRVATDALPPLSAVYVLESVVSLAEGAIDALKADAKGTDATDTRMPGGLPGPRVR